MKNNKKVLIISFTLIVVVIVLIGILFANASNKEIKMEANRVVTAINDKDMKMLESLLFGMGTLEVDEEITFFFSSEESESNGIISRIIEQDSIKLKKVTDKQIVYEITAPELSNIFNDAMKEENLTADSFEEYIYNYIVTADKTKIQVEVSYTYEDGVFTADYSTQEFMNGITGNLITAYQDLIQQMIKENSGEGVE